MRKKRASDGRSDGPQIADPPGHKLRRRRGTKYNESAAEPKPKDQTSPSTGLAAEAEILLPGVIRIATLNVWGLRTRDKRQDLKFFLYDFKIDVAIITETHLLKKEGKRLNFPGFKVIDGAGIYNHKG